MPLPSSLLAYEPQLKFMELAMDHERGMRMFFPDYQKAEHFRMRCNNARALHRKENEKVHEPGMPLHGKSEYDVIVFKIKRSPDGWWVYAEKQTLDESVVEPIPEQDVAEIAGEGHEIFQLEDQTDDNQTSS